MAHPQRFDDIPLIPDTLRVLRGLGIEEGWGHHIADGTPGVTPAVFPCVFGIVDQVSGVLCRRVRENQSVKIVAEPSADLVAAVAHSARAVTAQRPGNFRVDVPDVLLVLIGDFPPQLCCQIRVHGIQRQGDGHGVFLLRRSDLPGLLVHHFHLAGAGFRGIEAFHKVRGLPVGGDGITKAEDVKSGLDTGCVKTAVFRRGVDRGHCRIQAGEGGSHVADVGLVLRRNRRRERRSVEACLQRGVVVVGAAGTEGA